MEHFGLNVSDGQESDDADDASRHSVRSLEAMFILRGIEDSMTSFSRSGQPSFEQ